MSKETTTKFKVDISELKAGVQEANRQIALANSQFKEASAGMDNWRKSTEGISAKIQQLKTITKSYNTILSDLEGEYKKVVDEQGENSQAAIDLQVSINNLKASIKGNNEQIAKYEKELSDLEKQSDEVAKAVKTMGDGFTVVKGAIANFIADGISNLISGIGNAIEESKEHRKEMALLDTAFQTSNLSAEDARNTYKDLYGILGDGGAATEAAQQLAKISKNEQDLEKNTRILTGVMGEWGTSIPTEGLAEGMAATAAMGSVQGVLADALEWQSVNLDDYNAKLATMATAEERATYIQETLLELYGDSADAFLKNNEAVIESNKTQARYNETMAQLAAKVEPVVTSVKQGFVDLLTVTLDLFAGTDTKGFEKAVKTGFSWAVDVGIPALQKGFTWLKDNIPTVATVFTGLTAAIVANKIATLAAESATEGMTLAQIASKVAQDLLNKSMLSNPISLIILGITALVAAFKYLWDNCEPFREFWIGLWDGIKNACSVAIDAIVNFFTVTIPEAFSSVINWIKENWDTLLVFLINPFAGLFTYFYENNNKFKEFVDNAVNCLKELPNKICQCLLTTISKVTEWNANMTAKAREVAVAFVNRAIEVIASLPGKVWTWLTNVINKVVTFGVNLQAKGKQVATNLCNAITGKMQELPTKVVSIGSNIVKGLWNGIGNMAAWIKSKIEGFGQTVLNSLKDFFGIHSPAKVPEEEVGKPIVQGIAVGIKKNTRIVIKALEKMSEGMLASEKKYLEEKERLEKEAAEKEYNERLANAKDAEEREKIKHEKIAQEQKAAENAYLESLREASELERKELDRMLEYAEITLKEFEESIDAIVAKQDKYADRLMKDTEATFSKMSFTFADGTTEDFYKLPDMSKTEKQLSDFSALLDEVFAKRGDLPEEVKELLANMDVEEGTGYLKAMLNASDAEWEQYVGSFAERKTIAEKMGEKLFPVDPMEAFFTTWENLPDEVKESWAGVKEVLAETPSYFGEIYEQAVALIKPIIDEAADYMCETVNGALDSLQSLSFNGITPFASLNWRMEIPTSDAPEMENGGVFKKGQRVFLEGKGAEAVVPLENNVGWIRATARDLKAQMKAEGLVSGSHQAVTNKNYNFVQNNTSPKPLSRLEIYRQTHNLLSFARG